MCKASSVLQNLIKNEDILSTLEEIKVEICQKIDFLFSDESKICITKKADNTIVTEVDIFVSDLIKKKFLDKFTFLNFFSEEDQESFKFPMIILDPIDGTKEFSKGFAECAVSFGIYYSEDLSDKRNFSWIFNPFNNFTAKSESLIPRNNYKDKISFLAYVSNTEFEKGLHKSQEKVQYVPKGSIAYKLGLLASGACDFVISKKPKNIWDVMAGTHICFGRNIYLYQNGKKITSLSEIQITNDLVWASEEVWSLIKDSL